MRDYVPIGDELRGVAQRFRILHGYQALTAVWLAAIVVAWWAYFTAGQTDAGLPLPSWLVVAAGAATVALIVLRRRTDLREMALRVERLHPELETKLLAAYDLEQRTPPGGRGFLEETVIREARTHALTHDRWQMTVPRRRMAAWGVVHGAMFTLLLVTIGLQAFRSNDSSGGDPVIADGATKPVEASWAVTVEPGNVELERGTDLLVLARFADGAILPAAANLTTVDSSGEKQIPLTQSLSDPIFAGRVSEVRADLTYRLNFGSQTTQTFRVTVFDYPELQRADADISYPEYTELPVRRIQDVRQVSMPEGSELKLLCRLNKAVATARLVPAEGEPVELQTTDDDATLYSTTVAPTASIRYRLELTDDRGRKNRGEEEFVIDVTPNRPPELKLVFPRQDAGVSPLQELALEAETADDFGVVRWGVAFELTGKGEHRVTLGEKLPAKERRGGKHLVALEELKAVPDELLAWHAWAEDLGPDGKLRRTTSDIFFAEVNPFEEIFREGSSPPSSGHSGESNPTDESAKLQKEIISATWNLRRRETGAAPSVAYAEDARVIAQSQQKAIESLDAMKERLQSPDAVKVVADIEKQMQAALAELTAAAEGNALPTLDRAIPAEQAAYQGLLKLRARESRITRSRSASAGGGGQQSANGQKLDQLELSKDQDRYETESRAADPRETPAAREREEFLNRLRELARRQEDMNEKIKEAQAALEAARDAAERERIERELKRLRDEQRSLLRDVDQLQNRLNNPEHNQPQTEASKQLEKTRENVRQASDALERSQTPQALAAGTRAESELDQLREDFRKQTASRFTEEVRDLLDRAEKLNERQRAIGDELTNQKPPPRGGLRNGDAPAENLVERLAEQRKELRSMLDQAREITERAESNEPLLSRELYDAVREAHQQQTPRAVDMLRQLVEHDLPDEAKRVEPRAREGIGRLRDRIEKAAQGVMGDDVESLRRAKSEVDRLAQALVDEMRREMPGVLPDDAPQSNYGRPSNGNTPPSTPKGSPSAAPGGRPQEQGKPGETPNPNGDPSTSGRPQADQNQPGRSSRGSPMPNQLTEPNGGLSEPKTPSSSNDASPQNSGKPNPDGSQTGPMPGSSGNPGDQGRPGSQPSESPSPSSSGRGLRGRPGQNQQPNGDQPAPNDSPMGEPSMEPQPGGARTAQNGARAGFGSQNVLTGADWREWSDALRSVEEFVPGTRLRGDAARVREQAQALRAEAKRHSKAPNWELVREQVYQPLVELQRQLNEELLRRESREAAVPLDRDPVPARFGEAVRRYYERLGSGQ